MSTLGASSTSTSGSVISLGSSCVEMDDAETKHDRNLIESLRKGHTI